MSPFPFTAHKSTRVSSVLFMRLQKIALFLSGFLVLSNLLILVFFCWVVGPNIKVLRIASLLLLVGFSGLLTVHANFFLRNRKYKAFNAHLLSNTRDLLAISTIPKRYTFRFQVEELFEKAGQDASYTLFFLDIDDFKSINNSLGHSYGDQLLEETCIRLLKLKKDYPLYLGRLGGDEFLLLLDLKENENKQAALLQEIKQYFKEPFILQGTETYITVSIGAAKYPQDGKTYSELLKSADNALYSAKLSGRSALKYYQNTMSTLVQKRLRVSNELHRAFAKQEFCLFYQPKISLFDGSLEGFEALIRWRHPSNGLVMPGDFIHLAEETGFILDLGTWILQEACRQAEIWYIKGFLPRIAVNVSAYQLLNADFSQIVLKQISRTRIPYSFLELEITETSLIKNPGLSEKIFAELNSNGILIASDDFGTGYSNLKSLQNYAIQTLKIDQSFVANCDKNKKDEQFLRAIIDLGNNLGMHLIAEGVERESQSRMLRNMGCHAAQGFLYSQALEPDDAEKWLKKP